MVEVGRGSPGRLGGRLESTLAITISPYFPKYDPVRKKSTGEPDCPSLVRASTR